MAWTGSLTSLAAALLAFVGTHFLFSHPLRRPLVGALGEGPFRGLYSLVALASFAWALFAYGAAPYAVWWPQIEALRLPVNIVMAAALILLVGGFTAPNPFVRSMTGGLKGPVPVRGSYAVTRHPMMWAIGLWGLSHAAINGDAATVMLAGAMAFLALAGAALQDRKLRARLGGDWAAFAAETSYTPFLAMLRGKSRPAQFGLAPVIIGLLVYALLAWAHPLWFGAPAWP